MKKLAIKTTICILVPVIIFLIVGCMKTPEINKDFGPKVSLAEINQALTLAKYASTVNSINNIKTGEFAYYEKSTQIENIFPMIIQQKGDTVTNRVDDASGSKTIYTITRELKEIDPATGASKDSKTQESACLEKTPGACGSIVASLSINNLLLSPTFTIKQLSVNSTIHAHSIETNQSPDIVTNQPPELIKFNERMKDLSLNGVVKKFSTDSGQYTYHNLQKKQSTMSTPSLVTLRPDCGGKPNCSAPMKTYEISFDEVDWQSEAYPVKFTYKLVFSPEAPFFSALMLSCGATTIPYQNQRISLLQCETARDFTAGK